MAEKNREKKRNTPWLIAEMMREGWKEGMALSLGVSASDGQSPRWLQYTALFVSILSHRVTNALFGSVDVFA